MSPVADARTVTLGAHGIDNLVNVGDGSTLTFLVRTASSNLRIGGQNLSIQQNLGGSGDPVSVSYKLTANKEYSFTVSGSVGTGANSETYTVFIYNDSLSSASYDIFTTTH